LNVTRTGTRLPALLALVACLVTGTHADRAEAQVPTTSARALHDTVGVVAYAHNLSGPYGDWSRVLGLIRELGAGHVRTPLLTSANAGWNNAVYGNMRATMRAGVRFNLLVPFTCATDGGGMDPCLRALKTELLPHGGVESVEWPNEHDISGDQNWAANLSAWGKQLHQKMKADPALAQVKVVGPSLVHPGSRSALGDHSAYMDRGNLHPYTASQSPSPAHMASERLLASLVSGQKGLVATEVGFYTSFGAPNGGHPPADEPTAALYSVRTVLEHFASGIERTYFYELINSSTNQANPFGNFGLLRSDFSRKPAFTALKNLLAMIGTSAPATVRPLAHSVAGDASDLRRIVVQQDDGTHLLVLWRTASVWDRWARRPLQVAPIRYTVSVPGATAYEAGDPMLGTGYLPGRLDGDRITVDVGANPVLLRIRSRGGAVPAAPGTPGRTPPPAGPAGGPAPGGSTAALDTRRPRLARLRVKRVGRRYVASFRLSEAARVSVRLDRGRRGSRTRFRFLRRLAARPLRAGARSVTLGRKLKPGRHRVLLTATDAAGNDVRVAARFRVRARRR
jgi:hypothetical protein